MTKIIKKSDNQITAQDYVSVLQNIKTRIQQSQTKAILSVNKELILLYWHIGKIIVQKQKESNWGSSFIETLAKDLQSTFPSMTGLSKSNIFYMRSFYLIYENEIFQQAVGIFKNSPIFNIPWGHPPAPRLRRA